ncbi:bifunctional serine/threonine-protein kinase/ABC transporter substrate-binding protein [Streptomyces marincola]|uniref:bifunctional serine/threonine-protein kinase/ABC transporter substrate-binding protein n=1 Tax=Streptomyces marincola TaxID=2878388 RepID=UPI001CF4DAE6|nr:bifunctional serine/threonine-protein kinase/ABC transporter substrate-binding protein [Streptomyces marincola]UCM86639.1 bifunctional serine/threonine-protein kinase/ABC transporter substrate-binding protein [Streptomyces marincola]
MTEELGPRDPARLAGYRLLGRLGAGGMGVVYLARSAGGALVAVKTIQEEFAQEPGFRSRFTREVAAARRVDSRFALPVIADGEEAGVLWLASPYVPGPSLAEVIAARGPLPARGTRALGAMLAEALLAVHAAGLVHRDVKPGNVLLALDGPRLIDFGIARAVEGTAITRSGVVVGSPGFLSPEQAVAAGPVGPPSDVFSLGCVLAEAASGRPPFGTGTAEAVLYRTVHDPADLTGVPDGLRDVVARCLAKDPAARPAPEALREELAEDIADGWLPEPVTRLIGERTAAAAALPGIVPTEAVPAAGAGPDGQRPAAGGRRPSRRALLLAGAGVVAAGGGLAGLLRARGGSGGGAGQGPRHVIGLHADLSGAYAARGLAQERGAVLGLERFLAEAEDLPFRLELRVVDDGGTPEGAVGAAEGLAADDAVLAVIGPTDTSVAAAAGQVYDAAGLPLLSVSVGSFPITTTLSEYTTLLHARPATLWQGLALQELLDNRLGARRVGLVDDRSAGTHSWEITRAAINFQQAPPGFEVVPHVVPRLSAPFDAVAADLVASEADTVLFGGHHERAAQLAIALDRAGWTGTAFAGESVLHPGFVPLAGRAAEGWRLIATCVAPDTDERAAEFAGLHRERFDGDAPEPFAAEAHDAVRLLAGALRDTAAEGRADRAALLARARQADHRGVGKRLGFDEEGLYPYADDGLYLYEVRDGAFRFEGPAPSLGAE